VFDRILRSLRERIRQGQYVMSDHAEQEMDADELTVYDLEHAVLMGQITRRQQDRDTGEWKYCIRGPTLNDDRIEVVVKKGPTDKVVFLTVFRL